MDCFKDALHRRRFGEVALELDGPVHLGGYLRRRLTTAMQKGPQKGFRLRLHGIHRTACLHITYDSGRQKLVGGFPDRQAADWLADAFRRAIDEGRL